MGRGFTFFVFLALAVSLLVLVGLRFTGFVPLNTQDTSPCTVDFNEDGAIDLQDFGVLKDNFGATDISGNYSFWRRGDANLDGVIDIQDFGLVKGNFGQNASGCPNFCSKVINCSGEILDGCCPGKCLGIEDLDCVQDGVLMNSLWTANSDVLVDGAWESSSCSEALSVVDSGEGSGEYALRADSSNKNYCCVQNSYGYHCYNLYVVNKFPKLMRSWGGEMYINLKNVDFSYSDVNGLAVLGAYNTLSSGNRDFTILARAKTGGRGNLCFSYFWPWMGSAAMCGPDQSVDISKAMWESWIKVEWWFSNNSNLYVKVGNTSWSDDWRFVPVQNPDSTPNYVEVCDASAGCARSGYFCDNGICKTDFDNVRVGWVSSYLNGNVMIKNVKLYDGNFIPDNLP